RDIEVDREALARTYPAATGDLVVVLHGLCETDASWGLRGLAHYGDARSTHGERLRDALGITPLYLRYNTGRHVCQSGDDLALLLARVVEEWPVQITRLTLVGHSMGGLVVRAACHRAQLERASWLPLMKRVV